MKREQFLKKHGLKPNDVVSLHGAGKDACTYEGSILPVDAGVPDDVLVLKLKSGYNAGIKIAAGLSVKKLGTIKKKPLPSAKPKNNPKLPDIAIIQVGGTIAAMVDYKTGGVSAKLSDEQLLAMFPKLAEIANYRCRFLMNILSENIRLGHYPLIAKAVADEIKKGAKGVIITHGTDAMGYTSAALSFMLENVPVPVLLVGAQRSSDRGSTDAALNMWCAANFIAKSDFAGVAICMHENLEDNSCLILPGTKTRKMHTSRRDAFRTINAKPIARVSAEGNVEFIAHDYMCSNKNAKFALRNKIEEKVALVKATPAMYAAQIDACKKLGIKGVVLEGTGLGHTPTIDGDGKTRKENAKILGAISSLAKSGVIVVMASQCINGRVQMHVYSAGVMLHGAGVIGAEDMLPETALIKLAWLLGNCKKQEVKELFTKNLRGEITECSRLDTFPQDFK
ncbi:MAG: Glu-tRNA(Gln) amidotransferase subunit GatD [Candidatus Diapherotrites archaeon]|nr:Glu-tRNA(Gln) amidotransferase subunit GatD [Candidatus Micrarchaeota archaeon]MBU1939574.1 Glu-tRNA(Gln) amidotransferase subunit GatD [Candidatus Micrarchaeota archaeon]